MKAYSLEIRVEQNSFAFYTECPCCKKKFVSHKLPNICKDKTKLCEYETGNGTDIRQKRYNKSRTRAELKLKKQLNLCSICESWVCDACFRPDDGDGICVKCAGVS